MTTARARDLLYGRRGGGWLPDLADPGSPFAVAVADGSVVFVRCGCPHGWWVSAPRARDECHVCHERYRRHISKVALLTVVDRSVVAGQLAAQQRRIDEAAKRTPLFGGDGPKADDDEGEPEDATPEERRAMQLVGR